MALFDVIREDAGDSFAAKLVAGGDMTGKAVYYKVDITESDAVKTAVADVVDKLGNLVGCVHCAGVALKREWTNDIADSIPYFKKVSPI